MIPFRNSALTTDTELPINPVTLLLQVYESIIQFCKILTYIYLLLNTSCSSTVIHSFTRRAISTKIAGILLPTTLNKPIPLISLTHIEMYNHYSSNSSEPFPLHTFCYTTSICSQSGSLLHTRSIYQ